MNAQNIEGSVDGDRILLEATPYPAHVVLSPSPRPAIAAELHQAVDADGVAFDIAELSMGDGPRIGIRPLARLPTLVQPAQMIELLMRATAPAQVNIAQFSRPGSGSGLRIYVVDLARVSQEHIETAAQRAGAILGLDLSVVYREVSDDDVARFAVLEDDLELDAMVASDTRDGLGMSVFIVREIGEATLGRTTSSPISPFVGEGGVVISSLAPELGLVLAHEVGHALGLHHTTERDGRIVEGLRDTQPCRGDANADGVISASECVEGTNLMFWSPAGSRLSGSQRERLRHSPLLAD